MDNLLQQVQAVLSITPTRWLNLTESLPLELLTRPPAPNEWPAVDCLRHLLDTELYVFPVRVKAFFAGQDLEAFNPDAQGTQLEAHHKPAELASEFARRRAASLNALSRVTLADLSRTARHSELGVVSLGEMLHEWAAHDFNHTVQAERAVMQPFIAGSGPWRSYFRDYDVGEEMQNG